MNDIDENIIALTSTCEKHNITVEFTHTEIAYPNDLPSNKDLEFFYKKNNPIRCTLDMGGSLLKLFRLEELLQKQKGYRWLANSEGKEVIPSWNVNHIVIADDIGGGKPIIAEIEKDTMSIYASYDGLEPFFIAKSLGSFISALGLILDMINTKYEVYEIYDENEEILENFKIDFFKSLKSVLDNEGSENLFDYFYG